jgi:hypothetical protein
MKPRNQFIIFGLLIISIISIFIGTKNTPPKTIDGFENTQPKTINGPENTQPKTINGPENTQPKSIDGPKNTPAFTVVTYETDLNHTNVKSYKSQLKKLNYPHVILTDTEWKGWHGRFIKYTEYLNNVENDHYILFTDARDVLVNNQTCSRFLEKALQMYQNKVIIGTEDNCCTGTPNDEFYRPKKVKDKILNVHRIFMDFMKTKAEKINNTPFYYLNFGLLFGKVSDLKILFEKMEMQPGKDDQLLLQKVFYENPELIQPDYNHELFSNSSTKSNPEKNPGQNPGQRPKYENSDPENCYYIYDETKKCFKNTKTNTYPIFIQTPGKKWECYKYLEKRLLNP